VDDETIIHEITHSTAYGLFPLWFEEGLAHFMEYYLTDQLEKEATLMISQFTRARSTVWLDVRQINYTLGHEIVERAGGFLVLKSLYDIHGIEGLGALIRNLRTKKYNDQELVAAIYANASPDLQPKVRQLFCDRVTGTTKNYCTGA
jgi:hypothetical protein